jgi:hypothetical protein
MNDICFSAYAHGGIPSESQHQTGAHAASWLSLAAAPAFALMSLLTGLSGGGSDMLCSTASNGWPLSNMASMYLLMSVFHAGPWLKLFSAWRTGSRVKSFLRRDQ